MTTLPYTVDVRRMDEFSARELYALLKMRVDVFVVEQKCPYPELDGKDPQALHLRLHTGDDLIASARILRPVEATDPVKIGRVLVSPAHRGKKLGDALMREAITVCEQQFSTHAIALSAQSHLQLFYQSFGFAPTSDEYFEDGIPHIDMLRPVSIGRA